MYRVVQRRKVWELREQVEAMRRQLDEEERRREEEEGRKAECSVMIQAAVRGYDVRKVREVEKCVWYGWGCGVHGMVFVRCVMSVSLCGAFSFIRVLNPSKMARLLYFDSSPSILLFHCRFIVHIVYHSVFHAHFLFTSLLFHSLLHFSSLLLCPVLLCPVLPFCPGTLQALNFNPFLGLL